VNLWTIARAARASYRRRVFRVLVSIASLVLLVLVGADAAQFVPAPGAPDDVFCCCSHDGGVAPGCLCTGGCCRHEARAAEPAAEPEACRFANRCGDAAQAERGALGLPAGLPVPALALSAPVAERAWIAVPVAVLASPPVRCSEKPPPSPPA
jgi:hypothetical protein